MRESLVRQQQEIAALQAFIDENSIRKKEGQDVNGFLEDMVHQSKLDALAAEERERRRTKELMGVVATVWDYRGKERQGRSVSRDRNSRDRKSKGREPSSKVEARSDDTSSKVLVGHRQPLPLPGRDGNPRESQMGGSVLLSTFNGLCTPQTHTHHAHTHTHTIRSRCHHAVVHAKTDRPARERTRAHKVDDDGAMFCLCTGIFGTTTAG